MKRCTFPGCQTIHMVTLNIDGRMERSCLRHIQDFKDGRHRPDTSTNDIIDFLTNLSRGVKNS